MPDSSRVLCSERSARSSTASWMSVSRLPKWWRTRPWLTPASCATERYVSRACRCGPDAHRGGGQQRRAALPVSRRGAHVLTPIVHLDNVAPGSTPRGAESSCPSSTAGRLTRDALGVRDRLPRARRGRAADRDGRRRADRHRRRQRRRYPGRLRPGSHRAAAVRDRLRADEPVRRQRRRLLRVRHEGDRPARRRGTAYLAVLGYNCFMAGATATSGFFTDFVLDDLFGINLGWQVWSAVSLAGILVLGRRGVDISAKILGVALVCEVYDPARHGRVRPGPGRAGTSARSTPTWSSARASASACCSSSPASSASRRRRCSPRRRATRSRRSRARSTRRSSSWARSTSSPRSRR